MFEYFKTSYTFESKNSQNQTDSIHAYHNDRLMLAPLEIVLVHHESTFKFQNRAQQVFI